MYKQVMIITILILCLGAENVSAKVRGGSKVDGVYSKVLAEQRELLIQLPNNYQQNKMLNYPVLYLLDGLRNFNHVVGTLDLLNQSYMAQEMIIVAIKNTHRTRDFTPTYDESYNQWGISGGADDFLDFIEQELIPYVNKNYRTNDFKILSGHSLGGLLAVYALQTRPELFQAHFAFSPSLWWHDGMIFNNAQIFYRNTASLNNYLYLNMGNEGGHMLSSFKKYTQLLQTHTLADFSYNADHIEQEGHNTTALVGHNQAYRHLFSKFQCPKDVITKGIPAIEQCYRLLSEKHGYQIKPSYQAINHAGYSALENKDIVKAIEIFKANVKNYPYIADAYDSLADGYEANGQLAKAVEMINIALDKSMEENVENNAYKTHRANLLALIKDKNTK